MAYGPCQNPNCASHGQPHPNCRCYMAEGGVVQPCECHLNMADGGVVPPGAIPVDQFKSADQSFGSPTELFKTFTEGAAQGVAGPVGTAALRGLGGVPEEMRIREETNPVTHTLGQAAGLLGGGAGILRNVASKVATRLPARLALENALFTAGDEVSKFIKEDPNASIQSAIIHTGLSGAIGGATGKATELAASKLGPFVDSFKSVIERKSSPQLQTQLPSGEVVSKQFDLAKDILAKKSGKPPVSDKLAEDLIEGMLEKAEKKGVGGYIGQKLGAMSGLPFGREIGAYLGYKHLDKAVESIGERILNNPTSAMGFHAALETIDAIVKGQHAMNTAARGVFELGSNKAINLGSPDKLLKKLDATQSDPTELMNGSDDLGHYLPDHSASQGMVVGTAVQYLNSLRPKTGKEMPLESDHTPNKMEQAKFKQALQIVEQPLTVFDKIKRGTLTPDDLKTVGTVYPDMYKNMQDKLTEAMITHVDKGGRVPYSTALNLSMFLGVPLERSITPYNIMANQGVGMGTPQAQQAPISQPGANQGQLNKLSKLPQSTATPGQARSASKLQR